MKRLVLALTAVVLAAPAAWSHFVWIVPEDNGTARVIFSDSLKPDAPELLAKIAQTEVFVRDESGKTTALKWKDEKDAYRLAPEATGQVLLGSVTRYGVIQRGESAPFLLNYYAKAQLAAKAPGAASKAASTPWDKLPLEIVAAGPRKFAVLWQGKPLANAEVAILAPGAEKAADAKADGKGEFSVPAGKGGVYGLRAKHVEKTPGTHEGKKYSEARSYSTFALVLPEAKADSAPALKEDLAASKLLKGARAARALWANFPGFSADATVNFDGKVSKGTVRVEPSGKVTFTGIDAAMEPWAKRSLVSTVGHRIDESAERDTPCAFPDDNQDHPLGRTVRVLTDELHSSYRIRDNQIMEVNRQMRDLRFTISVVENRPNAEGKYLSVSYAVNYWNAETGALQKSEAHHQTWNRVGKFDLPVTTTVITSSPQPAKQAQSLTLSNHRLLEK